MLNVLYHAAVDVILVWSFASVLLVAQRFVRPDSDRRHIIGQVWVELRPFYLPAVATAAVIEAVNGWTPWWQLLNVALWFLMRDAGDNDDRWKRRRRRITDRVAVIAGRLTIQPAAR